MKARYVVNVDFKKGTLPLLPQMVKTAVYNCGKHLEDIQGVSVEREACNIASGADLFAYGKREGGKWILLDYFNTYKKAENAVKMATKYTLLACGATVPFAAFIHNPNKGIWERC